MYECQTSSYQNILLKADIYICYWFTFFINKSIICQNSKEECFLLYYLKDVLIRFFVLPLGFLLVNLGN